MKRIVLLILFLIPMAVSAQRIEIVQDEHGNDCFAVYAYGLPREVVKTNKEMADSRLSETPYDYAQMKGFSGVVRRHHTTKGEDQPINGASESLGYDANRKISFAFIIAPFNIKADATVTHGKELGDKVCWADASGWSSRVGDEQGALQSGNSGPGKGETVLAASPTGCARYRGISGEDEMGTWRLPTQREAQVIFTVIEHGLVLNNTRGANKIPFDVIPGDYWTSTELYSGDAPWWAWSVNSITGVTSSGPHTSLEVRFTRCVKDIYDPVNE